jgi:hypothetical protein
VQLENFGGARGTTIHSLENKKLVLFLLVHNQIFAGYNGEEVFVVRFLDSNNFIWLPRLGLEQGDWNLSNLLECFVLKDEQLVNVGGDHQVHTGDFNGFSTLEVGVIDEDPEVVHILPLVNVK